MPETRALPIAGRAVTLPDTFEVRSPFDDRLLGVVPACGPTEVDEAVAAAKAALATPIPAFERARILDAVADALSARAEEFAQSICGEAAKPIKTARVEVARAVETFRFAAVEARTLTGEVVAMDGHPAGVGKFGFTLRVPVGVIGAISPFNFPLNLVAHKLAPAIAADCPVVLKPASQTPLTAILLAEAIHAAGLPPERLSVVTGGGGTVGNALVDHDDIALITFTGSPEVGWGIKARAPKKRVGLELGNNAPVIVEPDADLALAASKIVAGGFAYSGQTCISVQRVYAHESIAAALTAEITKAVETLVVGDPWDDATDVTALINTSERDRIAGWIEEATAAGATAATGGRVENGILAPTILTDVRDDMKVCAQEIFGPVVGIQTYAELDDAFARANDSRYGLQASIFTNDVRVAFKAAHALDFGGVLVNEMPTFRTDQMPYGGVRDSGNTKEGPHWSVREMTEERMVVIQL